MVLLVRSMSKHLKRIPPSFDDRPTAVDVVPDTPAELIEQDPRPGEHLLDTLRRAPRAIEPPRADDDGRPDRPARELIRPAAAGAAATSGARRRSTTRRRRPPGIRSRVNTRNGSRARTPEPERGHALERPGLGDLPEGRNPVTFTSSLRLAGRKVGP